MTMRLLLLPFLVLTSVACWAQADETTLSLEATPKPYQWELGLHAGHFFNAGDVDFNPSFAGGLSFRKATDYAFSLRGDLLFGTMTGEDAGATRKYDASWFSGTGYGVITWNNLKWYRSERKRNLYVMFGGGFNSFKTEFEGATNVTIERELAPHAAVGGGIAFKVNDRINIAFEHQAFFIFGTRNDLVDGFTTDSGRGSYNDVPNYTNVRININMGNSATHSQPLYWLNPLDVVLNDIQFLKDSRVSLQDTDGDGIIDLLDQEMDSPVGALVNAKGVTLDTDRDGVADHLDMEPFTAPNTKVDAKGVTAVKVDMMKDVEKLIDQKLANYQPKGTGTGSLNNWFLPTIYFETGSAKISKSDYATLASVARVLADNPSIRILVSGHADAASSDKVNNTLSFKRAESVIDHLVKNHQIDRSRLVLKWSGESAPLTSGVYRVNRRVDFSVAKTESDMAAPTTGEVIRSNSSTPVSGMKSN